VVVVDVVAVQAQARLQAQRVARAEAGGLDLGLREQRARRALGVVGRHRDLEAVLAGVARARDEARAAGELEAAAGHEGERGDAGVRRASAVTAFGPCSASSARSGSGCTCSGGRCW
jgi:hypothetical protein